METIIDATRLVPGGIATRILSDMGYNIIKLEDTGRGDYMDKISTGANDFLNRGKKSISIDLKNDQGKAILYKLVKNASVFMESFRGGVPEKLGMDYKSLHNINPDLVYCSIKGYANNPEIPGHDINFTAFSGIEAVLPVQIADTGTGMYAALEILNHLKNRDYSKITINMSEIPVLFNIYGLFSENNVLNGKYPCYRIYNVSNGKIALGCMEQKFWKNFVDALKRPKLEDSRLDLSLNATMEQILYPYTYEHIEKLGHKYNFPVSAVRDKGQIIKELSNARAPNHGENTIEILKINNYTNKEIQNLKKNNVIK
jgi:crotonobetainyl-CoA:carnitine CoA-transferase CaiB-like acyl-CoA transferase